MVRIDSFCVDQYEASLEDVQTGKSFSPYFNPGKARVRAVSVAGAVPQGHISGAQAAAACAEAGKRLCSDKEWLRAAKGPRNTRYPYGDERRDGVCNDSRRVHPAAEYFGTDAPWIYTQLDHPCISQLPETVDATGANADCRTPEGVFDVMGNLHEWTADPAGTFRGGYFADTRINGEGNDYVTRAHSFDYHDYSTGFRCCADPRD